MYYLKWKRLHTWCASVRQTKYNTYPPVVQINTNCWSTLFGRYNTDGRKTFRSSQPTEFKMNNYCYCVDSAGCRWKTRMFANFCLPGTFEFQLLWRFNRIDCYFRFHRYEIAKMFRFRDRLNYSSKVRRLRFLSSIKTE